MNPNYFLQSSWLHGAAQCRGDTNLYCLQVHLPCLLLLLLLLLLQGTSCPSGDACTYTVSSNPYAPSVSKHSWYPAPHPMPAKHPACLLHACWVVLLSRAAQFSTTTHNNSHISRACAHTVVWHTAACSLW
jgi:hypothetical protein